MTALVIRTAHVQIKGRVQGVGYRVWTQRMAIGLGLRGWVRNRREGGAVEALFQGPETAVARMIACCEAGPHGARVTNVAVLAECSGDFVGFEIRETE